MEHAINLTNHWAGILSLIIFVTAYGFVMAEEFTHLRKSKPVILAAGAIWAIIAIAYGGSSHIEIVEETFRHGLLEYAELAFFLLVAMTYIAALEERDVFNSLKVWLIRKNFNYRQLFWITGVLAFFMSPLADNLTTALVLCAVVMAVGSASPKFISMACINIVVAANAGGAFSPFGDITTLMVWQAGKVEFFTFFALIIPSIVNYIIPAVIMSFFIGNERPTLAVENIEIKFGGKFIILLGVLTIATAVSFHNFFHLPPVLGMMTGLSYLLFFGYYIKRNENADKPYDVLENIAHIEWDTLLFFFGVIISVSGLGLIGYLELVSQFMYTDLGATNANILVGILSAIVDNIPVMFAVLSMDPSMPISQWLLATLTAGVGGSMLSIGSAAGVALMGQAKGYYTFFGHLKWAPVIAIGYFASIYVHILVNF
ncbi:sodium:proton antiporter NhaD [Pelagibacteraceae bacterium]|jgi:NhaD family Na+/H+ antiporter|nr:sodium:proton antiporter NhaD [Pelagibacteraceae bacterium]MDC1303258.1 sodium:proton antiporter NhaD [Pelagibacterales bacterium]|tara:strand:+ start:667 stop:1953 length:1287 start_codon:yes stop_codon:yes gene_type:complete